MRRSDDYITHTKMAKDNIWDYWVKKLIFPKTVITNKPGIIINKTSSKYGRKSNELRTLFFFEETAANLQLETVKLLGREKTNELFYKIGKDIGARYVLLSNAKRIKPFLVPSIINYIFETFKGSGFSVAEKIRYDHKNKSLVLEGKENMICRITAINGVGLGIISSVFSFLMNENIEGEPRCTDCPNGCKFIFSKNIKQKYIPNLKELKETDSYKRNNLPTNVVYNDKLSSFNDFIKFKKIEMLSGNFYFMKRRILPMESGLLGIITGTFIREGLRETLEKGITGGAENIARQIFNKKDKASKKMEFINAMLCAYGWGIPSFKKKGNDIFYDLKHPPMSKYPCFYQALVINGYLNVIFKAQHELKDIKLINGKTIRLSYKKTNKKSQS